jgi:hypothetical protein
VRSQVSELRQLLRPDVVPGRRQVDAHGLLHLDRTRRQDDDAIGEVAGLANAQGEILEVGARRRWC